MKIKNLSKKELSVIHKMCTRILDHPMYAFTTFELDVVSALRKKLAEEISKRNA